MGDNGDDVDTQDDVVAALEEVNKLRKLASEGSNIIQADKQQNIGVIQRIIAAVADDKNYRQILKSGNWKSTEEEDKAVIALACCDITGAIQAKKILLDKITAHSAGINNELLRLALDGLTHTTYTMQGFTKKNRVTNKGSGRID